MTSDEIEAWKNRIVERAKVVRLDQDQRALADALVEFVVENPDDAAHLIASLLDRGW